MIFPILKQIEHISVVDHKLEGTNKRINLTSFALSPSSENPRFKPESPSSQDDLKWLIYKQRVTWNAKFTKKRLNSTFNLVAWPHSISGIPHSILWWWSTRIVLPSVFYAVP